MAEGFPDYIDKLKETYTQEFQFIEEYLKGKNISRNLSFSDLNSFLYNSDISFISKLLYIQSYSAYEEDFSNFINIFSSIYNILPTDGTYEDLKVILVDVLRIELKKSLLTMKHENFFDFLNYSIDLSTSIRLDEIPQLILNQFIIYIEGYLSNPNPSYKNTYDMLHNLYEKFEAFFSNIKNLSNIEWFYRLLPKHLKFIKTMLKKEKENIEQGEASKRTEAKKKMIDQIMGNYSQLRKQVKSLANPRIQLN